MFTSFYLVDAVVNKRWFSDFTDEYIVYSEQDRRVGVPSCLHHESLSALVGSVALAFLDIACATFVLSKGLLIETLSSITLYWSQGWRRFAAFRQMQVSHRVHSPHPVRSSHAGFLGFARFVRSIAYGFMSRIIAFLPLTGNS